MTEHHRSTTLTLLGIVPPIAIFNLIVTKSQLVMGIPLPILATLNVKFTDFFFIIKKLLQSTPLRKTSKALSD